MKISADKKIELKKSQRVAIGPRASVDIALKGSGTFHISLARHARVRIAEMVKGAAVRQHITITLDGVDAAATVTAGFLGSKRAQHELEIVMHHRARSTTGDILIKGVYADQSRGRFGGLIKIDQRAQQTKSFFADNVLLLDDGMATSVPTLEIEADDVQASHGSTTSSLDQEQLFYLQSRGIAYHQARDMITRGFLTPILDRMQTI